MADSSENEARDRTHSSLACFLCRKRKVKCGRELPQCTICKDTSQECSYPAKAMRPGPKIGSIHASTQKRQYERNEHGPDEQEGKGNFKLPNQPRARAVQPPATSIPSPESALPHSPSKPNDMMSLSLLIHPRFESSPAEEVDTIQPFNDTDSQYVDALMMSCNQLGLSLVQLNTLLPRYFEICTAFQLFRYPELHAKIRQVPTATQRTALLAAMLGFALKGLRYNDVNNLVHDHVLSESVSEPSVHFRALAIKSMEEAITEIGDEPLSLPLLQALILNTHCLLVQGVRGRAWRYLGLCVRSAYELNLHLIDAGKHQSQADTVNADRWCVEEEWRRAWWAIWEMDVFASTIRRCPTGIDWSQNLTLLPAEDEKWHRGEQQPSSFLEVNIVDRWKQLVASNNQSPKAWFIVINSLMKDAQNISSPTSVGKFTVSDQSARTESANNSAESIKRRETQKKLEATNRLLAILNSLHCSVMALPSDLRYYGQHLTFGGNGVKRHGAYAKRLADSSIYSIYVMTQLTKLMSLKYHVFRAGAKWSSHSTRSDGESDAIERAEHAGAFAGASLSMLDSEYLAEYFESADNIVGIIRRCPEDYYKYLNPFLASTSWLAGAVQLVRRSLLSDDSSEKDLVHSNFELLSMTYRKTVAFWNMSKIPLSHWQSLEDDLEQIKENPTTEASYRYEAPFIFTGGNGANLQSKNGDNANSALIKPSPLFFQGGQSSSVNVESVEGNAACLTSDSGMGDSVESSEENLYRDTESRMHEPHQFQYIPPSHNHYTTDPILDGIQSQQSMGVPPLETSLKVSQFSGMDTHSDFSSSFIDPMVFSNDRAINLDFSNYLDEMLSGSYMP